ncbi:MULTISPECIES: hypothetical protein [unclassified Haematospirillum]|uniref:hypothetical protein n=1 Tax=unclassified Haematospirillum TaxID=2622088 RepID=UPI00143A3663|nr:MULTISPECIES: hypothetical protein [unclassified Haematospirillum]NKD55872.1 hypothetical protein [Haematospirillum sp. H4890]NKD75921.1 hypothetical protein [Haematospirillum sp. H4485]
MNETKNNFYGKNTRDKEIQTWNIGDVLWSARIPDSTCWLPADGKPRRREDWPLLADIAPRWMMQHRKSKPNTYGIDLSGSQKENWETIVDIRVLFEEGNIFSMVAGDNVLVAAGKHSSNGKSKPVLAFSYDGIHWVPSESANVATLGSRITDVAYGHQPDGSPMFIAGASNGMVAMSADGANWTPCSLRARGSIQGVTYGLTKGNTQGMFMVLDQSGSVHTSANGQDWNSLNVTENAQIHSWLGNTLTWGITGARSGLFMAAPANRKIFASRDGEEWNYCHNDPVEHDLSRAIRCMTWGRRDDGCGVFIAGCNNGRAILSENGHMWNVQDTPPKTHILRNMGAYG